MRSFKYLAVAVGASALVAGCGLNPFGAGQSGLKLFANVGKAVSKPSLIDDEKNSKDGTKAVLATGAAKRLAKGLASAAIGVVHDTIIFEGGDRYTYEEQVKDKPSEEDSLKLLTGTGRVSFRYSPGDPRILFTESSIIAIDSFYYVGRENVTWKGETDSIRLCVKFSDPSLASLKPGFTWMWGKNISGDISKGDGDTAYVSVDSLNDAEKKQYGGGHFLDLHTGSDNAGDSYAFDFNFEVWHMADYANYRDNEGELSFVLPWGASSDSLYFQIHFYSLQSEPNYRRTGTIKDSEGVTRVEFDWYEKTNSGTVKYYKSNGDLDESE